MKKLSFVTLAVAALACSAALSADLPTSDAAALQSIGRANEAVACSQERAAVVGAASGCTDSACRIAIAAIAALTPCSAVAVRAAAPAPSPQIINAAPPPTVGERIVGFFAGTVGKIFDTAVALGPSYLNMRAGNHASDNATRLGIAQSNNALAAQVSTNGTFAAFGNNIQGTAAAGFGAATNIANAGFVTAGALGARPTTQISAGNGSAITVGNGNQVQIGSENRQASPGPCSAQSGSSTTGANGATAQAPCTN